MSNKYSYQQLGLDMNQGVYYNKNLQKVLTLQDPYNLTSYNSYLCTQCNVPNNKKFAVMENYRLPNTMNDPYNINSYDNVCSCKRK
jgi:hypothetical protein